MYECITGARAQSTTHRNTITQHTSVSLVYAVRTQKKHAVYECITGARAQSTTHRNTITQHTSVSLVYAVRQPLSTRVCDSASVHVRPKQETHHTPSVAMVWIRFGGTDRTDTANGVEGEAEVRRPAHFGAPKKTISSRIKKRTGNSSACTNDVHHEDNA